MEIASDFAGPGTFVNQDPLVANQYPRTVRTSTHPGYNQFSDKPFQVSLIQGFPTWGTCTPGGTFAYLKGYI